MSGFLSLYLRRVGPHWEVDYSGTDGSPPGPRYFWGQEDALAYCGNVARQDEQATAVLPHEWPSREMREASCQR